MLTQTGRMVAALVLVLPVLGGCESKVTSENFDQISTGLSLDQVEQILGSGTDITPSGVGVGTSGLMDRSTSRTRLYSWRDGNAEITVTFKDGQVLDKRKIGLD